MKGNATTDTMAEVIRDEALDALMRAEGTMTFAEIHEACQSVTENWQLSNALFALKNAGKIVSPSRGVYQRASILPARPASTAPKVEAKARIAPASAPEASSRAIIERLVADTQAALDDYLSSVADPKILEPLRQARDNARQALAAIEA